MGKVILILLCLITCRLVGQVARPRLVVGIVIDQMRYDYLYSYGGQFGESGFKRLLREGFSFDNLHYHYIPTYTGPGHAAVYTGATPAVNGIIGNSWYDKRAGETVYCAGDEHYGTVGASTQNGRMSPGKLLTTTITDQLRLTSRKRSKVIGLSVKDRGAIFPAGHMGEAYWYDKEAGSLITSTYYTDRLPQWVADFNEKKRPDHYLRQTWDTRFPPDSYDNSDPDHNAFEAKFKGRSVFPYDLKMLKAGYGDLPGTPFGNDYLTEAAISAIENAKLGEGEETDFLAVSYSSTDYIGHAFGPGSAELEDTYLRLDDNISQILNVLDKKFGAGGYLVFVTADHGVAEIPEKLRHDKVPAGRFKRIEAALNTALEERFGVAGLVVNASNEQLFLDHGSIHRNGLSLEEITRVTKRFMLNREGVMYCYSADDMEGTDYGAGGIEGSLRRGFHQKRSGDFLYVPEPAWLPGDENSKGTSHGSGYAYDTHVPLLWYGAGIKPGRSYRKHRITQIAPTLSMLLQVSLPSGAFDEPLYELLE